jgi:hypothetical protein
MAQIDSSIYNAFAPRVKSIQDYDNEAAQGQINQLNLLRGQQQADEYTRKVGQENAFRTFQKTLAGKSRPEQAQAYLDAGHIDQANALTDAEGKYQTAQANVRQSDAAALNSTATAGKAAFETRIKAHDFAVQRVSLVQSPQDAVGWAQEAYKAGVFGDPNDPNTQQRFQQGFAAVQQIQTPQQLEEWKKRALAGGMDAKSKLERDHAAAVLAESQRHNKTTEGISAGQLGVSQGQLGVARERLEIDRVTPRGVLDPERGLIVDPRTGEARPVTVGGAPVGSKDKPLTESQAKALAFSARLEASDRILAELDSAGTTVSNPGSRSAGIGPVINAMQGESQQRLDQAKRDFINAQLRRESGAVISPEEFDNADKQYFPQIGDSPAVIKQKAANRHVAIGGMRADVPASRQGVIDEVSRAGEKPKPGANPRQLPGGFELVD